MQRRIPCLPRTAFAWRNMAVLRSSLHTSTGNFRATEKPNKTPVYLELNRRVAGSQSQGKVWVPHASVLKRAGFDFFSIFFLYPLFSRCSAFPRRPQFKQASLHPLAANPPKGSPVAPCIIISGQSTPVRDSQHRRAKVHMHRSHGVCERLILILVNQRGTFRVIHLNHCRTTARHGRG